MTTYRETMEIQTENQALDKITRDFNNLTRKELRAKTREGKRGWQTLTEDELKTRIHDAVERGDTVAIANYATFMHYAKHKDDDIGNADEHGYIYDDMLGYEADGW